ncbi:MAG TPA: GtrA family protein [Sphingomicrobium sp.]|jgi:putative flippase GtrA
MRLVATRLWNDTFLRYVAASGIALGVDASCFFSLVAAGAQPGVAAAVGYAIGIAAHWLISSRAVFAHELAERGPARTRQKMLFVISALGGLALTTGIVSAGDALGINLAVTKAVAVGASFTLTWLARRWIVFRSDRLAVH